MDGEFEKLNKFDCKHLKTEPGAGEIVDTTSQVIGENSDHTTATTKNKTTNTLKKTKKLNSRVEKDGAFEYKCNEKFITI